MLKPHSFLLTTLCLALCALSSGCDSATSLCTDESDTLSKANRISVCQNMCKGGEAPKTCGVAEKLREEVLTELREPVPDTAEGLRATIERINHQSERNEHDAASLLSMNMKLPDPSAWFKAHFGPEYAVQLTQDYEQNQAHTLAEVIRTQEAKDGMNMIVHQVQPKGDTEANLLQMIAFKKAKAPLKLYTVRWALGEEEVGFSLWSFVHHEGHFYHVGKMWGLTGSMPPTDPAKRGMYELPIGVVEKHLKEKPE